MDTRHLITGRPDQDVFPTLRYAWYAVAVLLVVYSIAFVDRIILNLLVQPIRADLGLSDTGISLLQGLAFTIFYSIFGLILGRWADRNNRKRMIIAGVIVWCLATAACGFAQNFWQLFVARIFVGAGEAALSPAAYSLICDSFRREHRSRAISTYSMGIYVGIGSALIFGGIVVAATSSAGMIRLPLLGEQAAWRASLIVVGLVGLLAVLLLMTLKEPSRKEVTKTDGSFRDALGFFRSRLRPLGTVMLANALVALMTYSISAWLPSYFIRVFGWSASQIATAYGTVMLTVGCAGVVFGGWLVDRLTASGRINAMMLVFRWSFAALLLTAGWMGFVGSPAIAVLLLGVTCFLIGIPTGLGPAAINAITPNQYRGQAVAIYLFFTALIGLGIGPTAVALITDYVFKSDVAVGMSLGTVLVVASLIAAILLFSGSGSYNRALKDSQVER
ncbi:MFS transporter (plasmid) [Agrobacterium tumefaciens]|uniref:MFS transporter n=2 Tax=Agrobacterium tumefaciens TaxID=358 RepID=A0AAP9J9A7_AGRTU|nr:MFS transporter [Agrobacterium tumefaciens]NSZ60067.1 MFS transporter [Agrobacterium tumefaciens]QDY97667.1 MFS transporter [Agrobacterium tumefaciens]UXS12790.1 MFS transporter [Agrobacterium tumefaciens]UXS20151.1 MFS transporter [Agrobacterium tumefaciens]UXS27799.1 MFS transporter [Agrobacterium tumefaciens]